MELHSFKWREVLILITENKSDSTLQWSQSQKGVNCVCPICLPVPRKVCTHTTAETWLPWLLLFMLSKAIQGASQRKWVWLTLESDKRKFWSCWWTWWFRNEGLVLMLHFSWRQTYSKGLSCPPQFVRPFLGVVRHSPHAGSEAGADKPVKTERERKNPCSLKFFPHDSVPWCELKLNYDWSCPNFFLFSLNLGYYK